MSFVKTSLKNAFGNCLKHLSPTCLSMQAGTRRGSSLVSLCCCRPSSLCACRCAAVLCIDGQWLYTDGVPRHEIMQQFLQRQDKQITTLEILAIAIGLSTFADELQGRKVVVWSDNTGAESAARKGSARAWDHCRQIRESWQQASLDFRAESLCIAG